MSQNASSRIPILHEEFVLFSWESSPAKRTALSKHEAAKLICFTISNAELGHEALWFISSQLELFQTSKTRVCTGSTERGLTAMPKMRRSAAPGICFKRA